MVGLRAYQEELKKLLFLKDAESAASFLWDDGAPERLNVYRDNIRANWGGTLDDDFALTRRQFADAAWRALRQRYFIQHPPRHWELNASMAPFPAFIAAQDVASHVKELADFEWRDLSIFIDRAVVRPGLGMTNPTAVIRVYQHQMFDWVAAEAPAARPPEAKPEVLVFYRDAKNASHITEADPLMLLLLEHFRTPGARLDDAEPLRAKLLPTNHVRLANALQRLQDNGLILL